MVMKSVMKGDEGYDEYEGYEGHWSMQGLKALKGLKALSPAKRLGKQLEYLEQSLRYYHSVYYHAHPLPRSLPLGRMCRGCFRMACVRLHSS